MDETERLQRYKRTIDYSDEEDQEISSRILALLNDPKLDKYCMVDAYYYDFSVIPRNIKEQRNFCRDMYLIFGITNDGEIVSKWVERYDLDSSYPIINGEVIRNESVKK